MSENVPDISLLSSVVGGAELGLLLFALAVAALILWCHRRAPITRQWALVKWQPGRTTEVYGPGRYQDRVVYFHARDARRAALALLWASFVMGAKEPNELPSHTRQEQPR